MRILHCDEILPLGSNQILLDVRSPAEFLQGHIPGAQNLPLFSDEERAHVGIVYKNQSQEEAFLLGLKYVGPKMASLVRQAIKLSPDRKIAVHCWRGGQRSKSVAWLLENAGFDVGVLAGGYKQYRKFVQTGFENLNLHIRLIGGPTGVGKTRVLHELAALGQQVIDLEALANHKGSSFGAIGELPQPTVEQFENSLFEAIQSLDLSKPIWFEHESRSIGRVYLPESIYAKMRQAPLIVLNIPETLRLEHLIADYCHTDVELLHNAFERLHKRLGGLAVKEAREALQANDLRTAGSIALRYYDKTYRHHLENHLSKNIVNLDLEKFDAHEIAKICHRIFEKNLLPIP